MRQPTGKAKLPHLYDEQIPLPKKDTSKAVIIALDNEGKRICIKCGLFSVDCVCGVAGASV